MVIHNSNWDRITSSCLFSGILIVVIFILLTVSQAGAQTERGRLPATAISLDSIKLEKDHWKLAGDVFFNPVKKGKALTREGAGVLLNTGHRKELVMMSEHTDLELSLAYMLSPGSAFSMLLQGRYEVTISDDWSGQYRLVTSGAISLPGTTGSLSYVSPLAGVSKAPGVWQHLRIVFIAPRFMDNGRKTGNARFAKIYLNDVLVQDNIEVSGLTSSSVHPDEKASGPLVLAVRKGPLAFKKIEYKRYGEEEIELTDLQYKAYNGEFYTLPDFTQLIPVKEGNIEHLEAVAGDRPGHFAGQITGMLHVPHTGKYFFEMHYEGISPEGKFAGKPTGAAILTINGQRILEHDPYGAITQAVATLPAGTHSFSIEYFRRQGGWRNRLYLAAEGPGIPYRLLGAASPGEHTAKITVAATHEPVVLRSFMEFGPAKKTHILSVGEPCELNYSIDLESGALMQIWRGPFLETTAMWHERGEAQVAVPAGSLISLPGLPSLAAFPDISSSWPDATVPASGYRYTGYRLDEHERPVFKYALGSTIVEEQLIPDKGGQHLTRKLQLTGNTARVYCLAAIGQIEQINKNLYGVNGKQFLVRTEKARAYIRQNKKGEQELLIPATNDQILYTIIW